MPADPTSVADELAALRRIVRELDRLDAPSRGRAMRWLTDRYDAIDTADTYASPSGNA